MLFLTTLSIATIFASGASARCSPVPLYQAGRAVITICAESVPGDTVVLDLGDDWAPPMA